MTVAPSHSFHFLIPANHHGMSILYYTSCYWLVLLTLAAIAVAVVEGTTTIEAASLLFIFLSKGVRLVALFQGQGIEWPLTLANTRVGAGK